MTDKTAKGRLEKDAFNYIRLGTLLRKSRSPAVKTEVEKVVASALSIEEKISEIEKLDRAGKPALERSRSVGKSARADDVPPSAQSTYQKKEIAKLGVIASAHNRQQIMLSPVVSTFVDYVLLERLKFIEFARHSLLIENGWWALFPRMAPAGVRIMDERVLEYELGKLLYAKVAIDKLGAPLSHARYKTIKMGFASPTQFEASVIGSIVEIAELFRAIGAKVSSHLYTLYAERTLNREAGQSGGAVSPLDEILADQASNGQTMGDRGIAAARTAYAIAGYFMNPDVLSVIQARRQVKDELRQTMRQLERLCLSEEYSSIREQFGLLGF